MNGGAAVAIAKRALLPKGREMGTKDQGCNTAHQVNPGANAHLFALLHHLESLIEQHLAGEGIVNDFDISIGKGESSPRRVFLHGNAPAEGQFEHNASSERVRDVVVPE